MASNHVRKISSAGVAGLALSFAVQARAEQILIRHALVIDGTGGPARTADIRIAGDRIVAVGKVRARRGERVIDAKGLAVAPGFIDTHTHHIDTVDNGDAWKYLDSAPDALAAVSQGVTTSIVGQDGRSPLPLASTISGLEGRGVAVNVASYVGHGSVRLAVMGDDYKRAATPAEIERMRALVDAAMQQGALGLSTGLEYNPGIYSTPEEVKALAAEAARFDGRYITHIRSEDRGIWPALDEAISIGRETGMPVQISHLKLGMRDLWGQTRPLIARLNAARAEGVDVTADIYPYDYWETTLTVLFPDRNYKDIKAARYALEHIVPADGIRFAVYRNNPSYVGRTLADIAKERGEDSANTLMSLIVDSPTPERYELETMKGMDQADVDRLILWPYINICSDGALFDRHPRGRGTFTRMLGYYTRDRKLLSLEAAVHKMSGRAAAHMGLVDRGTIKRGFYADLVMFDPATVADRATPAEPFALSTGIRRVWVNGERVFEDGKPTGRLPGRFLLRAKALVPRALKP